MSVATPLEVVPVERAPSRQAETTRRALLAADIDALAEHGDGAASVRVITHHFGGEEGLYRAVFESVRHEASERPSLDVPRAADH